MGVMIVCPICGFRNTNQNLRCLKCQALLKDDDAEIRKAFDEADRQRDSDVGLLLKGAAGRVWMRLPFRRLWDLPPRAKFRSPWAAGWLSLLPGAGQVYNGQRGKALLLTAVWWMLAALCLSTLTNPLSNWLLIATLFFWVLIWDDAVATAVRLQGDDWNIRNTVALFCAGLFYAGMLATALQFLLPTLVMAAVFLWLTVADALGRSRGTRYPLRIRSLLIGTAVFATLIVLLAWHGGTTRIFTFVAVIKDSQAPLIAKGDKVFVNNAAYWLGEPRLGDVIHFDPARFSAERGSNVYSINIQDYFQRVCGLPGDVLEKKGEVMLRNGVLLPEALRPNGWKLLPDWEYRVPPRQFFAPVTLIPDDLVAGGVMSMLGGGATPSLAEGPGGMILKGWKEAAMVPVSVMKGRAVAICNPPTHRLWLSPGASHRVRAKE